MNIKTIKMIAPKDRK